VNPYIGCSAAERETLLKAIGAASVDEIFEQIPAGLRFKGELDLPPALPENELLRLALERAGKNMPGAGPRSFLGAGRYDHVVPSIVGHLVSRGEFLTSYTPYQPEASQGMLQAIFEYQTMVCELTGMDVSNASLYDGATALAEGALMALGISKTCAKILLAPGLHPDRRETVAAYLADSPYQFEEIPEIDGRVDIGALRERLDETVAAVAVQHPNYFGLLEDMQTIGDAVRESGASLIAVFDPVSLSVLAPPGAYGADIAVAEGQPLGMRPYFGGDSLGMFACSQKFMRKAPGRIIGEARDRRGKKGYVLALQTREQHIRREKATSNICTNQGLNALKAAITMSALGPQGLRDIAEASCRNIHRLVEKLAETAGAAPAFSGHYFKECAVRFPVDGAALRDRLLEKGFLAGTPLGGLRDDLNNALLICATETKTNEDIDRFAAAAGEAVSELKNN
jgi:glycine dehydrogenase subunit 1